MWITKRTGAREAYQSDKIRNAMEKAFISTGDTLSEKEGDRLLQKVQEKIGLLMGRQEAVSVEEIQDLVEQTLMEENYYRQMKSYILYREERTRKRSCRQKVAALLPEVPELLQVLGGIQRDFPQEGYDLEHLYAKFQTFVKATLTSEEKLDMLIRAAVELTTQEAPLWENISARLLNLKFRRQLRESMQRLQLGSFYEKLSYLTQQGLYGAYILEHYTRQEVEQLEGLLHPERDDLFNFSGLKLLLDDPHRPWCAHGDPPGDVPGHCHAPCHGGEEGQASVGAAVLRHAEPIAGDHGDPHIVQCPQALPPAVLLLYRHGTRQPGRHLPQHR